MLTHVVLLLQPDNETGAAGCDRPRGIMFEGFYGQLEARIDLCQIFCYKMQLSPSSQEVSDCTM